MASTLTWVAVWDVSVYRARSPAYPAAHPTRYPTSITVPTQERFTYQESAVGSGNVKKVKTWSQFIAFHGDFLEIIAVYDEPMKGLRWKGFLLYPPLNALPLIPPPPWDPNPQRLPELRQSLEKQVSVMSPVMTHLV